MVETREVKEIGHSKAMPSRKRVSDKYGSRKSRRSRGFPPSDNPLPSHSVHLPAEVRFLILDYLYKRDLKQLRLVSQDWCAIATQPLFEKVYISPHKKNLDVFTCMTRHPVISGVIKTLHYNLASFEYGITHDDYWQQLSLGTFSR